MPRGMVVKGVHRLKTSVLLIGLTPNREVAATLWPGTAGNPEKRARDYYNKGKALVTPPLRQQARRPHA